MRLTRRPRLTGVGNTRQRAVVVGVLAVSDARRRKRKERGKGEERRTAERKTATNIRTAGEEEETAGCRGMREREREKGREREGERERERGGERERERGLGSAYRSGRVTCVPEVGVLAWTNRRATPLSSSLSLSPFLSGNLLSPSLSLFVPPSSV